MEHTFLIGLAGRAGSGKDTFADMLGCKTYAFAKPLKDGLAAMGFPEPAREDKEKIIPGFAFTWRDAAQKLGTEWGRELQSDIWLAVAKRYRKTVEAEFLVISDVRFHNEADWVREHGALVHILGRETYKLEGDTAAHPSEHPLPRLDTDYAIDNSGTREDLRILMKLLKASISLNHSRRMF